jgi:lysophospholipase L1-like esterase
VERSSQSIDPSVAVDEEETMDRRKLTARASAALGGCVLSALIAEVVLRIHNPIPLPVRGKSIVLPVKKRFRARNVSNSKLDPVLAWSSNNLGFRGPDLPADFDRRLSIIAVGGSTTECRLLSDDKTWCAALARILDRHFEGVWLDNAGMDGHSTFGHSILLDQVVLDLHPKYVLFLVGVNDVGRADLSELDQSTDPLRQSFAMRAVERSELLSTLLVLYRTAKAADLGLLHLPELDPRTALRSDETEAQSEAFLAEHRSRYLAPYEARLRHLVSRTREGGIEPVLITQPALYGDAIDPTTSVDLAPLDFYGRRASTAWKVLELYNDVTRRVASEAGVLLVELARRMPKDSGLFYDWVHYTNAGSEKVAEIVADDLVPFLAARGAPAAGAGPP